MDDIEEFKKYLTWSVKLSPYKLKYKCSDDCKIQGCPSHIATFEISHATDTFHIDWGDGSSIAFDGVKLAMLKEFIDRMEMI